MGQQTDGWTTDSRMAPLPDRLGMIDTHPEEIRDWQDITYEAHKQILQHCQAVRRSGSPRVVRPLLIEGCGSKGWVANSGGLKDGYHSLRVHVNKLVMWLDLALCCLWEKKRKWTAGRGW